MKKTQLLLHALLALLFVNLAMGQGSLKEKFSRTFTKKANAKMEAFGANAPEIPMAEPTFPTPVNEQNTAVNAREGGAFSVPLGSSYNIFSVLTEGQNAVGYDPATNSLVFSHRQNFPFPGGSGIISFDVSTDGGATWDTVTKQVTPELETEDGIAINGNRYPNGAIYNPPGNTDPANAYYLGTGAALWTDPAFGSNWGWEWVASAKFDGTQIDESYYTIPDTNIYLSMGMEYNVDGSVWYANYRREQNLDHQLFNPVIVAKMEFEESSEAFTRTAQELPLNYSTGLDSFAVNPRVTFSPDGMTGYAVISGIDGDDDEIYPSVKPIVWKTADGGASWEKQPRIHYQVLDSLIAYTIPIDGDGDGASDDPAGDSPRVPYMSQYDVTVDADGRLHIIGSMISSSDTATTADDFGFVWVGVATTELFHFIYDGESSWEAHRISDWYNENGEVGGSTVDERVQAGRSEDGEFIFFSFCKTFYEEVVEGNLNNAPDIYGYAYSLEADTSLGPRNFGLEPGTDFFDFEFTDVATQGYFHYLAPVVISGGEGWDFELPIVYGVPTDLADDLEPINYFFLRSAGFDLAEFNIVSTEEPRSLESFEVFPNPSSEIVNIEFAFEHPATYRITLHNLMGQLLQNIGQGTSLSGIQRARLDVSKLTPGMYTVHIEAENGVSTRKLIVK